MSRDLKRKDVKKRDDNAIEGNSVIQLSVEGQLAFAKALLNPPEPNAALRRAFESHGALFGPLLIRPKKSNLCVENSAMNRQ